jgi:hypothetical protein
MANKKEFLTLEDILPTGVEDLKRRQARRTWGEWLYKPASRTLTHRKTRYKVPLGEIDTSAEMLDWIFQILHKEWGTAAVIHDFLEALDDLLDPQATYCSQGIERHANPKLLLKHRKEK